MPRVNIVGDGAGGLSAALFLAKYGHDVNVFGVVAALDILAREKGKDVQDWDTPPKD